MFSWRVYHSVSSNTSVSSTSATAESSSNTASKSVSRRASKARSLKLSVRHDVDIWSTHADARGCDIAAKNVDLFEGDKVDGVVSHDCANHLV